MPTRNFKILVSHKSGFWSWFVMPPSFSLTLKHFGEEQTESAARAAAEQYVNAVGYRRD